MHHRVITHSFVSSPQLARCANVSCAALTVFQKVHPPLIAVLCDRRLAFMALTYPLLVKAEHLEFFSNFLLDKPMRY
jgi:hypothetical protein